VCGPFVGGMNERGVTDICQSMKAVSEKERKREFERECVTADYQQ